MIDKKYIRITKADLAAMEDVPVQTLQRWMNGKYYEQLSAVGYCKTDVSLAPIVVRTWFELRGAPLTLEELERLLDFKKRNRDDSNNS